MENEFIVVKIGSMAMINEDKNDVNYNIIAKISRQLSPNMFLVSSGATEIGRLDYIKRNGVELDTTDEDHKADYASQGQAILMQWYRNFTDSRFSIRQILVEHQHFNDKIKCEHIKNLLLRSATQNAIPIINYNDGVSNEEYRKMEIQALKQNESEIVECVDNDETATQIAILVEAKILLLYTSVDGIYEDANNKDTLIYEICGDNANDVISKLTDLQKHCNGASRKGANGAFAKLEYVKKAIKNNIKVIIANPRYTIKDCIAHSVPCTHIFVN